MAGTDRPIARTDSPAVPALAGPAQAAHTPAYGAVDLTSCDREPIHVPGAIQPHGALLAVTSDGSVVMASANSADLLGVDAARACELTLADLLGDEAAEQALRHADAVRGEGLTLNLPPVRVDAQGAGRLRGIPLDAAVHRSRGRIVVELEPTVADSESLSYQSARGAMARLVAARTVVELADRLAGEIRAVSGFDRVMVYRFDEDWNGEVVAEDRRADLNPFLGLHYPATDIPAQARRLYTANWIRLIADIGYAPVPLLPVADPATGDPLDLSFSTLRSVSPVHIEYLSHMGVTASMSVSLIVDGELWGLIACHHYSGPHRPSHEARAAAEFLGQIASQMMAERERSDVREQTLAAQAILTKVSAALVAAGDQVLKALVEHTGVREVVGAEGIVLCFNGEITSGGTVPPEEVSREVARLLRREDGEAVATAHLAGLAPHLAEHAAVAAGALVVGTAADRWLLWFRPELEQVVTWGGDPSNAKLYSTEGPEIRLSPRKSFDKWREVVRGHSLPWTPWQLEHANAVRTHTAGLLLHRSREQIAVAESLQRSVVPDIQTAIAGLEIASTYLPATEYQLGGDWWDAVALPDGRTAFVVGDVAGHGVSAVAAMTQVRTALRAYLFDGAGPAACLDALDRLMDRLMGDQLASAIVVVVDPATGELEIANAGHPTPLLYGDGPARPLGAAARPLLGVGLGEAVAVREELPPGATLLLFTDGLFERRDRDVTDTLEALRLAGEPGPRSGGTHVPGGLAAWSAALVDAVPGDRDDDTTVLAVRRP